MIAISRRRASRLSLSIVIGMAFTAVVSVLAGTPSQAAPQSGAVYGMTNDPGGNHVVVYERKADGLISRKGEVATGGLGTGQQLGSQGALILSRDATWLFAVNAGSNDISQFAVMSGGELQLVDVEPSGGTKPISLTVHETLLYVLNADSDTISGFRVGQAGLSPLEDSTRPLSGAGTDPAQVQFSPSGDLLVVTEKATNLIDTYTVGGDGLPSGPQTHSSEGQTPFGFAFRRRHLIVSEAFGGAPGASALSSYFAARSGELTTISPSVPDGQTAACWVVISQNGRFAYTTNTGSDNISSYTISSNGELTLLRSVAATTGDAPTDADLSTGGSFLYVLNSMDGTISAFRVANGGAQLMELSTTGGLPPGAAVGIAAF